MQGSSFHFALWHMQDASEQAFGECHVECDVAVMAIEKTQPFLTSNRLL